MELCKMSIVMRSGLAFILFAAQLSADQPCAARTIADKSVVCACNATYCDDVTREEPVSGRYVAYTSSEGGLRFSKTSDEFQSVETGYSTTLTLDPTKLYQTIEGFGGAVTDAAGINWKNLSNPLQDYLINSYYGESGIEYSMVRTPIGGSDFSTHPYAYNELPENDAALSNYSLAYEDYHYKIPMIKAIMRASRTPVEIIATTWSPPVWMKSNHLFYGSSRLKPEFFQTYADYHYKFLEKYAAEGISVWAISTTNEPVNGVVPVVRFNSLGWTPYHMGEWIVNNLGPTLRNSTFKEVKILAVDDQRYTLPLWFSVMVSEHPKALDYIDGVAVHYYGDFLAPASFLSNIPKSYPGKFVISTEASEGSFPWQLKKVDLGSWGRAQNYISDIITDLNHDVVGWLDWNLCLNTEGGPNWNKNFVDSPIIVDAERGEFYKQPMFYAMGHFSKFVPRGSRRIQVNVSKPFLSSSVENVAFLTPKNTIVVIIHNSGKSRTVALRVGDAQAKIVMVAKSVTTVEFPYEYMPATPLNRNQK